MNTCIICGSARNRVAERFDGYVVRECLDCRYGQVDPLPAPEVLTRLYNSKEYFDTHMRYDFDALRDNDIARMVKTQFDFQRAMLRGVDLSKVRKVLEVGPGGGFAMKAYEQMGFDVTGLETSTSASAFIRSRHGLNVINTPLEDYLPEASELYDLIFLNHVLEHFLDPLAATAKLKSLLSPGGLLYLRVPDHDSYDRRAYGKDWPAYAYYHISNFSEASLRKLLEREGLEVLSVKKFISEKAPGWAKQMARWTRGYFLNERFSGRTITVIARLRN